ncbi:sugar-transfer associated ATP-grasp domain-containing protein [Luteimonas sp. A277]
MRYGASPNNYEAFGFESLSSHARSEYFTYRHNQRLMRRANEREATERLRDKALFASWFSEFTRRRSLSLADASIEDVGELAASSAAGVLLKPRFEGQGRGVTMLCPEDFEPGGRLALIYERGQQGAWIADERLVQHAQMTEWFGTGMAPVRIVTGLSNGTAEVMWAAITMGRGGDAINYHLGGIMSPVDAATGRLIAPAVDKSGHEFHQHPVSGIDLATTVIPQWAELVEFVKKAAASNPQVRYCGWDVGLTEDGPFLIEGNHDPGTYSMVQARAYRSNSGRGGLLPVARQVFGEML